MATSRICSVDGCGKPHQAKGFCTKHYQRLWKHGDEQTSLNPIGLYGPVCSVDGCSEPHHARGFCANHAFRFRSHGDPVGGGKPKTKAGVGLSWLRDHADYRGEDCLTYPFGRKDSGYSMVKVEGRYDGAHRLMCRLSKGEPPSSQHVAAHSCGRGHLGCVNPRHLRWATETENVGDTVIHGTISRGERRPAAKLRESEVREIREFYGREAQVVTAARYGISQSVVSKVQLRQAWGWLE